MREYASAALTAIAAVVGGFFSAQSSRAGDDARNSITVVYNHEATASVSGIVNLRERAKTVFPDTPIALVAGDFHLRPTGEVVP
jgi:metal-dependent hydrolase (beta-lactamase superfamily II)